MMSESKIDIWDDLTGMKGEKILEMKKIVMMMLLLWI